jgi:hypothetical protein
MEAKVRIIFVILIAAAGSGTSAALAIEFSGAGQWPETGIFLNSAEPDGPAKVHRNTVSPEDTVWFEDFLVVGGDTLLWEQDYGWDYAWQEYGVSPEDTVWFEDFLVVGGDTLLWEQVYGWDYAWQEYGVSPEDTVWFEDFLVVGGDTLFREQVYGWDYAWRGNDPKLRINIFGLAADWYDPGLLFGFDDLRRHYDPFHVEFLWRNSSGTIYSFDNQFFIPYIAPIADWIEIAVSRKTETERPLYTYYMPLPVRAPGSPAGLVQRRRSRQENDKPVISIIRSLFSSEDEK